jgi:hypothetical protein
MRGVVFLGHLDAGAAVLCDLINVSALHEMHTDVSVAQAVSPGLRKNGLRPGVRRFLDLRLDALRAVATVGRRRSFNRLKGSNAPGMLLQ